MTSASPPTHPLDQALLLRPGASGHCFHGRTTPHYWNMVGPYGGITAAVLLRAVLQHPDVRGEPLALCVNYAAAVAEGDFVIEAKPVRSTRSTQHWMLTQSQTAPDGSVQVVSTATLMTAVRRETWGDLEMQMPQVTAPEGLPSERRDKVRWLERYDMRFAQGALPAQWDGQEGGSSASMLWARDEPPRALDFCALAALADIFFPRIWLRRARLVPTGTVSMTVYFHAGGAELAAVGAEHILACAAGQAFHRGFFDQSAQLWSRAGQMLASTHQIVYFKE